MFSTTRNILPQVLRYTRIQPPLGNVAVCSRQMSPGSQARRACEFIARNGGPRTDNIDLFDFRPSRNSI
jgi:hypothetical protein